MVVMAVANAGAVQIRLLPYFRVNALIFLKFDVFSHALALKRTPPISLYIIDCSHS